MTPSKQLRAESDPSEDSIRGRLVSPGGRELAGLLVRVVLQKDDVVLAQTRSVTRGEFVLTLPALPPSLGTAKAATILLQVLDAKERVVAETSRAITGNPGAVTLEITKRALATMTWPEAEAPLGSLLAHESIRLLRERIKGCPEDLEEGTRARANFEAALRPLEWAACLTPDAERTLAGDPAAAQRLRVALLGLGYGSELPEKTTSPKESDCGCSKPAAEHVVSPSALAGLVAAAAWAAETPAEAQSMLNGIGFLLWGQAGLELALGAVRGGAGPAMQPLMAGPGPSGGLPPGWGPTPVPGEGGPGWPGGPVLPPKKEHFPIGIIVSKNPDLALPINQMPSHQQLCLIGALVAVAQAKRAAPAYEIRQLTPIGACPGTVLKITGINFGTTGTVLFPGKGSGVPATDVLAWSDKEIRVRVPEGAAPGEIVLSIYIKTLNLCGRQWPIYRTGKSIPWFQGGKPAILLFEVDAQTSGVIADPAATVTVAFHTSSGDGVVARVTVTNGATTVFTSGNLPGGTHILTFSTPAATTITDLRVEGTVSNACGANTEAIMVIVARQPRLSIGQVEVTQAIQRLDNSVRLAARRRTLVRVYVNAGLDHFTYTANQLSIGGITGTVMIRRGGQTIATVSPLNAPFTANALFFPYARDTLNGSLNFMLPFDQLSGETELQVKVWIQDKPRGVHCLFGGCEAFRAVNVNFEPLRPLSLVRVLVNDSWRGLPAPNLAQWQASLLGSIARFPVADDGWIIRTLPGLEFITSNNNLSDRDGWDDLLEDLDDVAGDASDSWDHTWVGLLPAKRPGVDTFTIAGNGRTSTVDRPWPLSNDYLVFAAVAGSGRTFAHELAHTFGSDHSGCPAGGPNAPEDVDYSLPMIIEDYAIDLYTMQIMQPLGVTSELMTYCGGETAWPSIVSWHRYMDHLK